MPPTKPILQSWLQVMRTYLVILMLSTISIFCSNKRSGPNDAILQLESAPVPEGHQNIRAVFGSDTLIDPITGFFHIKQSDSAGHLLAKIVTNLHESDSHKIFSEVESYNAEGMLVEESKTSGLIMWHHYEYKWDSQGRVIEKQGFGSGDIGSKEFYVYENGLRIRHRISRGRETVDTLR